jgi:hypothetical protein
MCHMSNNWVVEEVKSFFGDMIISKGFWLPQSPRLTPLDFFLWNLLKGRLFKHKPHAVRNVKRNITKKTV